MELKKEIGKRLAIARRQAGYTQEQACKYVQMSQPNYARFEQGVYELSYGQMITLCKLFDCSADYLLGLKEI